MQKSTTTSLVKNLNESPYEKVGKSPARGSQRGQAQGPQ